MTPAGIDPGTVRLVAQCLNHYATPGPYVKIMVLFFCMNGLALQHFVQWRQTDPTYLHRNSAEYANGCWEVRKKHIILSITNNMQRYTIFFIIVNAVHVSGGFSAHHQELTNFTHSMWYTPSLLAATASVGELELTHASGSSKQAWHMYSYCSSMYS